MDRTRTKCKNYAHICQGRGGKIENDTRIHTHMHAHTHGHSIPTERRTLHMSAGTTAAATDSTCRERGGGGRKDRERREKITSISSNTDEDRTRRGATQCIYERQW